MFFLENKKSLFAAGKKKKETTMQQFDIKKPLPHKPLFNPDGDTDVLKRRMIGGNTTNLNDYNNLK